MNFMRLLKFSVCSSNLQHDGIGHFRKKTFAFNAINGLLPKIDQLRYIARLSNAAVVEISKSKLDKFITNLEILIDKYDPLHYGKIRN